MGYLIILLIYDSKDNLMRNHICSMSMHFRIYKNKVVEETNSLDFIQQSMHSLKVAAKYHLYVIQN